MAREELLVVLGVQDKGATTKIKEITRELRSLEKQYKLAGIESTDYESKLELLGKQVSYTELALDEYRKQLKETSDTIKHKKQVIEELNTSLQKNKDTQQRLRDELEKSNDAREAQKDKIKRLKQEEEELGEKLKKNRQSYKETENQIKTLSRNYEKHETTIKELEKQLKKKGETIERLEKQYDKKKQAVKEATDEYERQEIEIKQLEEEHKKLETTIAKETQSLDQNQAKHNDVTRKIAESESAIKGYKEEIKKAEEAMNDFGVKLQHTGEKLELLGKGMTDAGVALAPISYKLYRTGVDFFNSSLEWETAWIGVEKTVEGTREDFDYLKNRIVEMSEELPFAKEQIAGIAESAGQLGIATPNIEKFADTMLRLGQSTNLSAEDSATIIAQFANITDLDPNDYERLASTLVDLGNKGASTERHIMEMALRVAGAGDSAGMSEAQILGLSASMANVGIATEAGGSSMSKLITKMLVASENGGKLRDQFANVAGYLSGDEFTKAFREDAGGVIIDFVRGLAKIDEEGGSAIATISAMGLEEVRLQNMLLRLTGASELMADAMVIANEEWENNTALMKESEKRNESNASKLQMMRNEIANVGTEVGDKLVPIVLDVVNVGKDWMQGWDNLSETTKQLVIQLGGVVAVASPLLIFGGKAVGGAGNLMRAFGKMTDRGRDLAKTFGGLGLAIGVAVIAGDLIHGTYEKLNEKTIKYKENTSLMEQAMANLWGVSIPTREELENQGLLYEELSDDLSPKFRDALEAMTTKTNDFRWALDDLNLDGLITEEDQNDLMTRVNDIFVGLEGKFADWNEHFNANTLLVGNDGRLDFGEQSLIEFYNKWQTKEMELAQKGVDEIRGILDQARVEKRALTDDEKKRIEDIYKDLAQLEARLQAQNEADLRLDKERIDARSSAYDLETVSKKLQNKRKWLDDEIAIEDEKYAKIEYLTKEAMKSEDGFVRANAEKKLIDAKKDRDDRVNELRGQYNEMIDIIREKNPEYMKHINELTGEELSAYEKKSQKLLQNLQSQYVDIGKVQESTTADFLNRETGKYDRLTIMVDETTGKIVGVTKHATEESLGAWESYSEGAEKALMDLTSKWVQENGKANQLLIEMGLYLNEFNEVTADNLRGAGHEFEILTDKVDGTKYAVLDVNGTPVRVNFDNNGVITNLNEVLDKLRELNRNRTNKVTVETNVATARSHLVGLRNLIREISGTHKVKISSSGSISVGRGRAGTHSNMFSGSPMYQGGMTWVNEQGWELVDLPYGTKITNNLASTQKMVAEIEAEIGRQLSNIANSPYQNRSLYARNRQVGGGGTNLAPIVDLLKNMNNNSAVAPTIHIANMTVRSQHDIELIAKELERLSALKNRGF